MKPLEGTRHYRRAGKHRHCTAEHSENSTIVRNHLSLSLSLLSLYSVSVICLSHFLSVQQKTMLILGGNSVRAQKAFALDYCASAFVTEGKISAQHPSFLSSHNQGPIRFTRYLSVLRAAISKHGTASVCVSIV